MARNDEPGAVNIKRKRVTPVDIDSIIIITQGAFPVKTSPDPGMPSVTHVSVDHSRGNSAHLTMGMNFVNSLWCIGIHRKFGFIKASTIIGLLRILGLMAVLSYMIVILFTWIYANHQGYVYFSAGEPETLIKYPEWALGFLGIIAAASVLLRELNQINSNKNS